MLIRAATLADAAAIAEIYAPVVRETAISFEVEPPSAQVMGERLAATLGKYPWLVAEEGGAVLGYAYASRHRDRAAYQWSVEVSVYVGARARRRGVGRRLYGRLFAFLQAQGFVNAYAGITLPNEGSVALHESFGFTPVGVYEQIGYKSGAWRDVGWWRLKLREPGLEPKPPVPLAV